MSELDDIPEEFYGRVPALMDDDALCASFDGENTDFGDDIYSHYHAFGLANPDWLDVGDEARRVYNLLMDEEVEDSSPIDSMLTGIAIGGWQAAMTATAAMLGMSATDLERVVEEWHEESTQPPPINVPELKRLAYESKVSLDKFIREKREEK